MSEDDDILYKGLKKTLFGYGVGYIEEFLGYQYDIKGLTHSQIEALMDEQKKEMSKEELDAYYLKFCIK